MTANQTRLYWREWAAVRDVHPEADRHSLHRSALGRDKSSKAFTNHDLDLVLATFRAISQPANLGAQLAAQHQDTRRLRHRIIVDQHAEITDLLGDATAADEYILTLLRERFHARAIDDLDTDGLKQLRNTLVNRIASLKRRADHSTLNPQPSTVDAN